jgi:cell division protein FtsZ
MSSPFLDSSINGAKGVVFNITCGMDLTLHEVNMAAEEVYNVVDPDANIIFGAVIDDRLHGEMRMTLIATGFSTEPQVSLPQTRVVPTPPPQSRVTKPPSPPPQQPQPETPPQSWPGLDLPDFFPPRRSR